jgi:hypothetical protein
MTTDNHHPIDRPAAGPLLKKQPAAPGVQRTSSPSPLTRGETSPQRLPRTATGK